MRYPNRTREICVKSTEKYGDIREICGTFTRDVHGGSITGKKENVPMICGTYTQNMQCGTDTEKARTSTRDMRDVTSYDVYVKRDIYRKILDM